MNRSGDWKRKSNESFTPNTETLAKREESKEIQSTDSKWSGLFSPRLSRVSIKKANETVEELRSQIRTSLEKLAKFATSEKTHENTTSPTSRRRKHTKKSPFPHQMEPRDSLLEGVLDKYKSKDLIEILQVPDLQGLVNLGFLILVSASAQLILHNYLNHGLLVDYTMLFCIASDTIPASFIWLLLTLFAFSSYYLQKSIVNNKITHSNAFLLHIISLICIYIIPIFFLFIMKLTPVVSGFLSMTICVLSMKMHSYYSTNAILRSEMAGHEEESVYPKNVTLDNFVYFLFVPTLVYEAHYPRTEKIRWWYAAKEFLQALGCLGIIYILLIQFVLPVLKEHPVLFAYDIMRLSIPSIIMWLLGFYSFFHCLLNALSEVLRYADRQFYLDWWNAESLDIFWRKWNLLVHEWLHRHIYWESVRSGRSKKRAMVLTFLFSAFVHELIFMVALRVIRPWFFLGMFVQIPLIFMSKWLVNVLPASSARRWGNIFVWFSLFLGQPFLEILYIREWFVYNPDFFCVDK